MLSRLPLIEIGAILAALTAARALSLGEHRLGRAIACGAIAVALSLFARALLRRAPNVRHGLALRAMTACAALAAATLAAGVETADRPMEQARTVAVAVALGLAVRLSSRNPSSSGATLAAALTTLAALLPLLLPSGSVIAAATPAMALLLLGLYHAGIALRAPSPATLSRSTHAATAALAPLLLATAAIAGAHDTLSAPLVSLAFALSAAGLLVAFTGAFPREAGSLARRTAAISLALLVALLFSPLFGPTLSALLGVLAGAAIDQATRSLVAASSSAKTERACLAAAARLAGAESRDEVVLATLDPLRAMHEDVRTGAELWLVQQAERCTLDVVGNVQTRALVVESERALLTLLRTRPADVAQTTALREEVMDSPSLAHAITALEANGAYSAAAGFVAGDLCTVLLIPRADREAPATYAEHDALRELAVRSARAAECAATLERARERSKEAESALTSLDATLQERTRALDLAERRSASSRAPVHMIGTLEHAWIGYSAPMRALDLRLRSAANGAAPLAIVCPDGGPRVAVGKRLHEHSSRAGAPCVVLDAAEIHPRDGLEALLGAEASSDEEESRPRSAGALELAGEGTLCLLDAAALGAETLGALVHALRDKTACRAGGAESYAVRARVLLFLRSAPSESGLPAALCSMIEGETLVVPSLASRVDDLETRVLFSIDRACRIHGCAPVGVGRDAMEALRKWPFPGDERELDEALERAVRAAKGQRITLDELPSPIGRPISLAGPTNASTRPPSTSDAESYDALERRILESALERANGNKSEAARALGLARTTFLDKLKKHGLRE